jgi:hypothetical protein
MLIRLHVQQSIFWRGQRLSGNRLYDMPDIAIGMDRAGMKFHRRYLRFLKLHEKRGDAIIERGVGRSAVNRSRVRSKWKNAAPRS